METENIIREHRSRLASILSEIRQDLNKARQNNADIQLIIALLSEKADLLRQARQAKKLLKQSTV